MIPAPRGAQQTGTMQAKVAWLGRMALVAVAARVAFSPSNAAAETITIKGSDTMVILGQRWAEAYMNAHPEARVQVTGGGSGTGISALINGTTDICQASRDIKPKERVLLKQNQDSEAVEIPVAQDGLAVYVHAANPVAAISIPQLKGIFTGRITNWRELGGPNKIIIVYSRESSAGTYVYFKDRVLDGLDFTEYVQPMPGTAAVVHAVSKEKYGIGYGGAAFASGIRTLKVSPDGRAPAIAPTVETVATGHYPLARPLFFYLRAAPSGAIGSFLDFVLSPAGQAIVTEVGYYPR